MRSPLTMSASRRTSCGPATHDGGAPAPSTLGAYGVAITGLGDAAARLLRPAEPSWPTLRVDVVRLDAPRPIAREHLADDEARYRLTGGGSMTVARRTGRCTIMLAPGTPEPSADALVHPFLTTPLATVRHWAGSSVFHAGGFVVNDRAWIVPATRRAGKSTLLATLATLGVPVLADDLVVVDRGDVLAGPACIDLREDAATYLNVGTDLGVVGRRRRWRYELAPVPTRVPLGGVISLAWDQHVALRRLPIDDRVRMLLTNVALRPVPPAADVLLAVASRPAYTFSRPRDLAAVTRSAGQLLARLRG